MNYEQSIDYIHSIPKFRRPLGNANLEKLLTHLGNPQKKLKFIHIAGTNGKGSTAAMTAEILKKSGFKTGLFTSPYLEVFNERIRINGENITGMLRTEEVGNMAFMTSAIPEVRGKLLELQRTLAREKDVIMDGRDIGTHVLPDADVKIYLTASVEIRAKRRYKELVEKGVQCDLKEIEKDIEERDYRDMTRKIAPLKKAEDAILVDSSDMTLKEVVNTISRYCHR